MKNKQEAFTLENKLNLKERYIRSTDKLKDDIAITTIHMPLVQNIKKSSI
jgi:hypothetical protein